MFGILRLLLAALVAASHCGWTVAGLNPGVIAVVVFYLLAGFVMQDQLAHYYQRPGGAWRFYIDRALRIYPVYWTLLALAALLVIALDYRQGFMARGFSASMLWQNLTVIPLNFYMFTGIDRATLIPPAWSLGAELQFYLVAPWLLRPGVRYEAGYRVAFAASAALFLAAALGWVNSDVYGYRLLTGVLFVFLTGAALARGRPRVWGATLAVAGGAALVAGGCGTLGAPYVREEVIGLLAGIPLILALKRLPRHAWDTRLGYLAYGVFLSHFLGIWWLERHPWFPAGSVAHLLAVLAIAVVAATLVYAFVDRPVSHWRRRLRQRHRLSPSAGRRSRPAAADGDGNSQDGAPSA